MSSLSASTKLFPSVGKKLLKELTEVNNQYILREGRISISYRFIMEALAIMTTQNRIYEHNFIMQMITSSEEMNDYIEK